MKNIYDVDKIDVLMDDHCTRQEAEKHLKNGSLVWTPEEFVGEYVANSDNPEETLEYLGCATMDELLSLCRDGKLIANDIANGIFRDGENEIPYVITYCL